jgi:hypothetical protein
MTQNIQEMFGDGKWSFDLTAKLIIYQAQMKHGVEDGTIVNTPLKYYRLDRPCGEMGRAWDSIFIAKGSGRSWVRPRP